MPSRCASGRVAVLLVGLLCLENAYAEKRVLATITFTEYSIPHITAMDFAGLGHGVGYAMALTDLCALAEAFATYGGNRSRDFGADEPTQLRIPLRATIPNSLNDLTTRLIVDERRLARAKRAMSPPVRQLVNGYVAGFNRRVAETTPADRPLQCRGAHAVTAIGEDEVIRRALGFATLLGQRFFQKELFAAAPPVAGEQETQSLAAVVPAARALLGSNAYAFGRDLTSNGSGLLLGNPHYVWDGPERFMEAHLKAPGYDVMGILLPGMPLVSIGFNASLAWTSTVSTDTKATLFRLTLDPHDPTRYLIDGRSLRMKRQTVAIPARDSSGSLRRVAHDFWISNYGPIVEGPGLPWDRGTAYALMDPNRDNFWLLDQSLAVGASSDVRELRAVLERYFASPFVNTIAADAKGETLYADMAPTPSFDREQLQACAVQSTASAYFLAHVMDGSRSICAPRTYPAAPRTGILPAAMKPVLLRTDYVANSNDSHWFTNPAAPLEGFSPLIGHERKSLGARTRLAHLQVRDRLAGADGLPGHKFDRASLESILFSNRNFMAEILIDDLLAHCAGRRHVVLNGSGDYDLGPACDVLASWDRRDDLDSRGAYLFREFLLRVDMTGAQPRAFWREPFDPERPLETPRGIRVDNTTALEALAAAAQAIQASSIALNVPLREVQFVERGGRRIPIHGGPDSSVFNTMDMTHRIGVGYTDPVISGATYIQVVSFEGGRPVVDALLVSGQTSDTTAPLHWEQTELYSEKQWVRLPYLPEEVANATMGQSIVLREP